MSIQAGSISGRRARRRASAFFAAGAIIGLLAAMPGTVGSINFPHLAWSWALLYFAVAVLFSPPSVALFWITRRRGRWRLVTCEKDLSNAQRGFFLGLSGTLALEAVAFLLVWLVIVIRSALA